jgi:hypothetical protein
MLDVDLVDPTGSRPEIGDYIPNIVYINRETTEKTSGGGGGGGRGQDNKEKEEADTWTAFEKNDQRIGMVVGTRNGGYYIRAGQIALEINKTGDEGSYESTAYIEADHVNISATTTVHTLAGSIVKGADGKLKIIDAGGLYVERTEGQTTATFGVWDEGNLTGGVIVQKINGETTTKISGDKIDINGSEIIIEADHIDISGVVDALETYNISCGNITAGNISGTSITSEGNVDCDNLTASLSIDCDGDIWSGTTIGAANGVEVGSDTATWQSTEVVTDVTKATASKGFALADGTTWYGTVMTGITLTTTTLNYLGGAETSGS